VFAVDWEGNYLLTGALGSCQKGTVSRMAQQPTWAAWILSGSTSADALLLDFDRVVD
jgi:hypothetical protein